MVLCAIAPIAAAIASPAGAAVHLSGVVSGTASISQNGPVTTIRTSNNAILNFSQFDIALGSTVNFLQPSVASRELDHINSGTPSLVNGSIVSNGTVYLVNPAGVVFGPGAVVDVNGIYVAGSHMADQDFLNKADHFSGISGVISNSGQIHANQVYLIGSQVINQGSIVAPRGMVAMLAGSDVLVSQQGSHVTARVVPVAAPSANVNSSQTDLRTSGLAAGDVYSLAIRHTGSIQAANVLINGGKGQVQVSGSIDASSNVAGTTGGTVAITGGQVTLISAEINVDGPAGGGTVNIGGDAHGGGDLAHADSVSLDSATIINADATSNGPGGSITLWSDADTSSSATLTARGGPLGGNGGMIETSGEYVQVTNAPDASASNGSPGTWLLDPLNVEITNAANDSSLTGTAPATNTTSPVPNGTIEAALLLGENVLITTNLTGTDAGTLTQDTLALISVALTSSATLQLQANSDMLLHGGISSAGSTATLNVELDQFSSAAESAVTIDTNPISINGTLKIVGGNVTLASGIGITAASVQISTGTVATQTLTTGTISISGSIVTGGGTFVAGGTSFTTNPGGTINTTGTTTGEVDINPTGPTSIGAAITTGGAGVYIDYSKTTGAAANGTITTSAAIITGGGVFAAGGTSFTSSAGGTINPTGATNGEVDIDPNGPVSIGDTITTGSGSSGGGGIYIEFGNSGTPAAAANGTIGISAAVTTGGGSFFAGGTTFTTNTGGTIATHSGNVTIAPSTAISIGASIDTAGGAFTATGQSFANSASISDDGGTTSGNKLSINTTSGSGSLDIIDINGALSWTAGTGRSVVIEGRGNVTVEAGGSITGSGALPVSLYTIPAAANVAVNGTVTTAGPFVSDGGNFTLGSSTALTAAGVNLNTATTAVNGDANTLTNGSITLSAPVIVTGTGTFSAGGTAFTANTGATITTNGGNVTIAPSAAISIGANINTTGGAFTATGQSFVNNASISDDGGTTSGNKLSINTTSSSGTLDTIDINGALSWTAGTGRSVVIEGGGGVTLEAGVSITGTGALPVSLYTIPAAANVTVNGTVTTAGPFVSDGGNFTFGSSTALTAAGVNLNTATTAANGDAKTLTNGTVTVGGPVVVTGGVAFAAGGTNFTTTLTNSLTGAVIANGTITTSNGEVDINPAGAVTIGGAITTGSGASGGGAIYLEYGNPSSSTPGPLANGAISISAAIATGGGSFFAGGKTLYSDNQAGSITTNGGAVTISTAGDIVFGGTAAINTGGGAFTATLGTAFTTSGSATITTNNANVVITNTSSEGIKIGAAVNTGGGNFTATGASFGETAAITTSGGNVAITINASGGGITISAPINTGGGAFTAIGSSFNTTAAISDGGVATGTNGLSINTTSSSGSLDTIEIDGALSWTAGAGRSVVIEGGGNVTIDTGGSITGGGALPISLYTTGLPTQTTVNGVIVTYNNVKLFGLVNTTGPFVSAGGNFNIPQPSTKTAVTILTASAVTLDTATVTPDTTLALNNQSVFISGPVVSTGGAVIIGGTIEFTDNESGTITTNGGAFTITDTGVVSIGQPITTGGGNFSAVDCSEFGNAGLGSITTGGGSVTILSTSSDGNDIAGSINTGGGAFSVTGQTLFDTAAITDGGFGVPSGTFLVSATAAISPFISLGGAITWAQGPGRSVTIQGAGDITVSGGITSTTGVGPLKVVIDTTSSSGNTISISAPININGAFVSDGGNFTVTSTGSITAQTVALETNSSTPDGQSVTGGAVTINGPIVTNGAFTVNAPSFSESASTGTITTNGGVVSLTTTDSSAGSITLESAVSTGGGAFSVSSAVTFASSGSGTINTAGGAVTIHATGAEATSTTNPTGITIGALVNTGGGNFIASAPIFSNTGEITDGGVNDSNSQGITITTTSGPILLNGPISWAASHSPITLTYGTTNGVGSNGVGLGSSLTVNNAQPIDFTNTFIALTGSATITGGNITMGTVDNGVNGGGSLVIQSAGTVSLQGAIGASSNPIGSLTVTGNNSAPPVTTLNGSIFSTGNVDFTGPVVVPTGVEIAGLSSGAQTLEFDGTIQGPGGLVVADGGSFGDVIRFNNNIGDQTPLAVLDLFPGTFGLVAFRWGTGLFPPGVLQQQPLTTVNIASGGNFEVNDFSPTTRTNSINATIDSYGPLNINIGAGAAPNKSNVYAVGQNEKLSVYGALTINANGGTVKTGDISNTGNLTIEASTVDFVLRGPTLSSSNTQIDIGMDLISGGQISLPGNATYVGVKGADGTGSFDVPGFVATSFSPSSNIAQISGQFGTDFSIVTYISPSLLFGTGNLLLDLAPSTLSATIPTFVPPTPFVYDYPISGAAPREMLVAGTLPFVFKEAFQPAYPGPVLQQDLKDTGVFTRDPSIDEILGEVDTGAIYNDLPQSPRPRASDYRAAANRLDPSGVHAFLSNYIQVFGTNAQDRKVQMSTDLQTAWDAYVSQSGGVAVSGSGFAQYCATTPSASNAQADLRQLHGLREQLGTLGFSYKEAQVAFQYNILAGMSANGMRSGVLAAAVDAAAGSH